MSNYQISCDSCGAEYHIEVIVPGTESAPTFCACCGEELEDVLSIDALGDDDDDFDKWDKLIEDAFNDDSDWKDEE